MWKLFCRAGHDPHIQDLLWSIWRRNPPCNAEYDLRAGLIVIEAWFRGYSGSPRLGGPRIAELYAYAGLLDYEDTRLKTSSMSGWDSPLHGRQAWQSGYVDSLLCNRLCTTLVPSGVYINRRA